MLLFRFEHKTSLICHMLYDSFAYQEGHHDSYPQFQRSSSARNAWPTI